MIKSFSGHREVSKPRIQIGGTGMNQMTGAEESSDTEIITKMAEEITQDLMNGVRRKPKRMMVTTIGNLILLAIMITSVKTIGIILALTTSININKVTAIIT